MLFDLVDLRLLIDIAELKSIARSAERQHLTLAAASARVTALESRFGMPLLYRENKGVQLSPAGEVLLAHAHQFMQQVERLKRDMQQYNNGAKGQLRIFANTTAVAEFMPAVLGTFLSRHPHVNVTLEERLHHDIVQAILDGSAELGIVAGPIDDQGLDVIKFSSDRLVLATALEHPLAGAGRISFADTLDYEYIGLHEGSTLQHFLDCIVAESGHHLKLRIQVRGFETMCRMVETNVGIAVLPQSAALRHSRAMQLALIDLTEPWAIRERSVVVRKQAELPPYARELVDLICALPETKTLDPMIADTTAPKAKRNRSN